MRSFRPTPQPAAPLLADNKASSRELRFLADRLSEAQTNVLRVAESRGGRLLAQHDDAGRGPA
ncbi:hypothetical protein SBI_04935 [Streptomyces bingchenggensis BCW-1]|uniref:Uncharacterized protein n=1 Tax=Streptomyces bingchenggensis (strain BCW-1) TaxID=749414 RepID=D7C2Z3_STRBB|nr:MULTISPECIES: hypothetical protein [Streptomyces]ADI08055.1 hypothetical protein SBI_04935 [Streptomyces bingchenggensis BCW-1]